MDNLPFDERILKLEADLKGVRSQAKRLELIERAFMDVVDMCKPALVRPARLASCLPGEVSDWKYRLKYLKGRNL